MNRRDFLLLKPRARGGPLLQISCESIYMRYVDARRDGDAGEPFRWLEARLAEARALRLTDRQWLAAGDLESRLAPLLAAFRAGGGELELG